MHLEHLTLCRKWALGRIHSLNALNAMVAGVKAGVILSKILWKHKETLYHNVICAIQELHIVIIILLDFVEQKSSLKLINYFHTFTIESKVYANGLYPTLSPLRSSSSSPSFLFSRRRENEEGEEEEEGKISKLSSIKCKRNKL